MSAGRDDRDAGLQAEPPDLSEDALARAFVRNEGRHVRFVPDGQRWMVWNGQVWAENLERARYLARLVCREHALRAPDALRQRLASERTMAATLRLASTDPEILAGVEAWDSHAMLLNTRSGVVDLTTGIVSRHDPMYLMTRMAAASVGRSCPGWRHFLAEITGGNREMEDYLRRLAGYCLTGEVSEQVFFFLHGLGANGKSVFVQTIATILGDYAATATRETFAAGIGNRHLTELAGLCGARLVVVPETERGRGWDEGRIKLVTGGERVRANFMYQDHFEFAPQFKLVVSGNHRPPLASQGEAIRRRLHLVPFTVTIPPERRDPGLLARLLEERDGILAWMIAGCRDWLEHGLRPPEQITAAVSAYLEEEDPLGQWLDCATVRDRSAATRSADLFGSWKAWAEAEGHPVGSAKSFGDGLGARGFEGGRRGGARVRSGLRLREAGAA